ncbi:MAG: YceI family protein [Proteobacteria bacterium]|nr:YceI family protein [Pseudomonadota bacterium]
MRNLQRVLRNITCWAALLLLVPIQESRAQSPNKVQLESYARFLPAALVKEAAAELSLSLKEAQEDSGASLSFQSAESSWASGAPIMNQVSFHAGSRIDIWLLRQRQSPDQGHNPQHWPFFAIVVDHQTTAKIAYFLEFAARPVPSGTLPDPISLSVSCSRCHANGPRRIRPEASSLVPAFAAADLQRLQSWNKHIERDGPISQVEKSEPSKLSPELQQRRQEVLPFPFCSECHKKESGIRSELRREHSQSIDFLLKVSDRADGYTSWVHGQEKSAMPLEENISSKERDCLAQWLMSMPLDPACLAPPAKPLDLNRSTLTVDVSTSFASFQLSQIYLQGESQQKGATTFKVITEQAQSGSRLRDQHMREKFLAAAGPITFRIESLAPLTKDHDQLELPVALTWNGVTRMVLVTLRLTAGIYSIDSKIDLRDFGLQPPQFLGLSVNPELRVRGQLRAATL